MSLQENMERFERVLKDLDAMACDIRVAGAASMRGLDEAVMACRCAKVFEDARRQLRVLYYDYETVMARITGDNQRDNYTVKLDGGDHA